MTTTTLTTTPTVPRWATIAAWAVPLTVLPSAIWRTWGAIFSDVPGGLDVHWYPILLSFVSMVPALLTLGLVQPWGEVVPGWVPALGGRTIPTRAVVVTATTGAAALVVLGGFYFLVNHTAFSWDPPVVFGPTEEQQPMPAPSADVMVLYTPLLAWPPLLIAVTVAYRRRRGNSPAPTPDKLPG